MQPQLLTKYVYRIRTHNGVVVENLQIFGRDEAESMQKLQKMYHRCQVLDSRILTPERVVSANYEEVLDLISGTAA